ncbi:MAG: isocitrate lyase/PEP mutase family protein [Burkholderiales bacterium]|nr:isocitrate lyase/PEP mutase family protein [Burkholderiales bacterium]
MATGDSRARLQQLVGVPRAVLLPGAFNALSARLIEDLGFEAVYVSGAGVTNMSLGLPDQGFIGLAEIAEHTRRIRDAVSLPILVDADTGFGNALNTYHTVRQLERAGADCIQIEDQVHPKRCGHFDGKAVVETAEMVDKIRAAADARTDSRMMLMARTDAAAVHGVADALERAERYAEAGADLLFVEALTDAADVRALPARLPRPLLMNLVLGGKTPMLPHAELEAAGYAFVLYANAALQSALAGMTRALSQLKAGHGLREDPALVTSFAERQRLVGKADWDERERRYAG